MNPPSSGSIPLQEYRRDIPPGWIPGDASYPLRTYFDKLKLWYRIANVEDEAIGPLVAGRLYGRASTIAMSLRVPRPDGTFDVGDAALVRLAVDEVRDPATNVIIQNHIPFRSAIPGQRTPHGIRSARPRSGDTSPGQVLWPCKRKAQPVRIQRRIRQPVR